MHVAMLGLGLIGGSVVGALHARGSHWTVSAWSPSGAGPAQAAAAGIVARAAAEPGAAIDGADLVVLAAPPLACLDLLQELAGPLRSRMARDAVVTDVASTKRAIVARAAELRLPFVGGHPMAGVEAIGYASADADLFLGRPWVVCADPPDSDGAGRVETLARAVGAEPVRLPADVHDHAVAAISHLPLVVAAALAESVLGPDAPDPATARLLAAGGWQSMTRLARGDVEMGAGIAVTNADAIAERVRGLRAVLDAWLEELDRADPDPDALRRRLSSARDLVRPTA